MTYVCRSCLLRLGQPWKTSTRERPLRQLLPRTDRRIIHAAPAFFGPLDRRGHYTTKDKFYNTPRNGSWWTIFTKRQPMSRHMSSSPNEKALARDVLAPAATDAETSQVTDDQSVRFLYREEGAPGRHLDAKIKYKIRQQDFDQRGRVMSLAPHGSDRSHLYAFYQWKAFVKTFRPASSGSHSKYPSGPKAERVVSWIQSCHTVEEMLATVPHPHNASDPERDKGLIMMALQGAPDKAHMVLECIFREHMPRTTFAFYLFEDTLELLADRLHWDESLDKHAIATELAGLITLILTHLSHNFYVRPFQSTIYKILRFLPHEKIPSWYKALKNASCDLSPVTELQFAWRLANSLSTKALSLDILRHLSTEGTIDINSPVAASVSSSILRFTEEQLRTMDDDTPTPAEVFGTLRELGLNPNLFTYTALVRVLCFRGDIDTALEVVEVMKHQGIQPDVYIYAALVNGCRLYEAYETLADLAVEAWHAGIRDPVLWNDVIYGVYELCRPKKPKRGVHRPALFPINAIYTRIFDSRPLRPFITGGTAEVGAQLVGSPQDAWFPERLQRLEREMAPLSPKEVLKPGIDTISIMIVCIVRHLPHPLDTVNFYTQFKRLLQEGHPDAERLVRERGTFVYDVILRSLVAWKGTMRVVIDIVRDMVKGVQNHSPESAIVQPPAPSIYTWTILIKGYMRNKRPEQAEHCIDLMQQYGVEPNIKTWTTLATGYAYQQDIYRTVDSLHRLEAAGFKPDAWTMRAFRILRNQHKAVEVLEKAVEASRLEKEREEEQKLLADQHFGYQDEDPAEDDSTLDSDLDERFYDLDAGTMPLDATIQMLNKVDHMGQSRQQKQRPPPSRADLDAALEQLEPPSTDPAVPERFWKRYLETIQTLEQTAPVDPTTLEHYEAWKHVRDEGLASAPPPKSLLDVHREEGRLV